MMRAEQSSRPPTGVGSRGPGAAARLGGGVRGGPRDVAAFYEWLQLVPPADQPKGLWVSPPGLRHS
jgi:hypothetical protein